MHCPRQRPYRYSLAILLTVSCMAVDAADRTIYRCVEAGVTTFSDRPCGRSMQVYSFSESTPATPPAASKPAVSKPIAAAKSARVQRPRIAQPARRVDSQQADCARIEVRLDRLRSRMRAAYTSSEGERLREQQREMRERRHELRCR